MVLVSAGDRIDGVGQPYDIEYRSLPPGWLVDGAEARSEAQLVVCGYPVWTGEVVDTCTYGGAHEVRFLRTSYFFRVYEARTSRPVAEFSLDSGALCPSEVRVDDGGIPDLRMLQGVASDDLENALRPIVEPGPGR